MRAQGMSILARAKRSATQPWLARHTYITSPKRDRWGTECFTHAPEGKGDVTAATADVYNLAPS